MKKMFFASLLIVIPFIGVLEAGVIDSIKEYFTKTDSSPQPKVGILIVHDKPSVLLEVKGKYRLYDPNTNQLISTRFLGKSKPMEPTKDGLKWGEEFSDIHQLKIVPDDEKTVILIEGREYPGIVYVYDIGAAISFVYEMDIEDYLTQSLPSQYPLALSPETLASIAIAARTNTLYQIENARSHFWTFEGAHLSLDGCGKNKSACPMSKAIKNTRKMVMSKLTTSMGNSIKSFPAQWEANSSNKGQAEIAKITLVEAEQMAKKGDHAAQILSKAFPDTKIVMLP